MESTNEEVQAEVAEIQISYHPKVRPSQRPRVSLSRDAVEIFHKTWDESKIDLVEQFRVMLLNRANKVLGVLNLSEGGLSATIADPKLIFACALKAAASILAHNHPSGNLKPSQADISLTKSLKEAGKFLELPILVGAGDKPPDPLLSGFKVKFDASVSQLAFLLKVFVETKLIVNTNLTQLFHFISSYAVTRRSEAISNGSLRSKFYSTENESRDSVRGMLVSMIQYIDGL